MSLAIVIAATELCKEGDIFLKDIFYYVLDCMFTLDKMPNINTLMCKISKSVGRAF